MKPQSRVSRRVRRIAGVAVFVFLAGCGSDSAPGDGGAERGDQPARAAATGPDTSTTLGLWGQTNWPDDDARGVGANESRTRAGACAWPDDDARGVGANESRTRAGSRAGAVGAASVAF